MRPVKRVAEKDVWEHWQRVEKHLSSDFRSDIRNSLPADLTWFLCEVQPHDIDKLFIISSIDWADISGGTFRMTDVAARLDNPSTNVHTIRIASDIHDKLSFLSSGGNLDSQLVSITDSPSLFGPFTLLEGNRRSVTFFLRNTLVGSLIFVGYSPNVVDNKWSRYTYRHFSRHIRRICG
jgi:hypothetical protein